MESTQPKRFSLLRFIGAVIAMLFRSLVGAYGLSVALFLAARLLVGEEFVIIAFYNTFAHLLWMPALVLLPICLLLHEWFVSALLVPAVAAFGFYYGVLFLPQETEIPADSTTVTVMTYNLLGNGRDYSDVITLIDDSNADVVVLQELARGAADLINAQLAGEYPHRALHAGNRVSTIGQGVLSKYPIIEDEYWQAALGNQRTVLQLPSEESIVLYNVHPPHPGWDGAIFDPTLRGEEVSDILERATAETLPVWLIGDFNLTPLSGDYERITAYYDDAYKQGGFGMGWTFPATLEPALRLDYIFIAPAWQAIDAQILPDNAGSDHLPVLATLIHADE